MEEKQVHTVPVIPNPQPLLTSHEGEVVPKFKQEVLQSPDQSLLEFMFRVLIFQAEELQHERVADVFVGR